MEKITAKDNEKIKRYAKLASQKKARDVQGLFVIEGAKLFEEAARSDVQVEQVFLSESFLPRFEHLQKPSSMPPVFLIGEAVEHKIAGSPSPQGIYAVCKKLDKPLNLGKIDNNGKFIALWDLQDPGNVGTIFRAAEAMGISGILVSENCCDVYSLKTIRAAMGSLFRMPFLITDLDAFLQKYRDSLHSYAAVVDRDALPLPSVDFSGGSVVVIGNEGNGLSSQQANCCRDKLTIPMLGSAESLNAAMAATIIIWEMAKSH
ncbi:MAG: RNA methyltransferase [Clostridiales bacterium]|nr:MAG: RNA methyltransferase [Clostridiales bacterium]